ncbi:MAG: GNAT family N-acetyltransferase, partial [Clostridia bacterium]|nr:GNAT family N-acetyltransferase [Clostridia bacterium]
REDEILKLYASVGWTAYTEEPDTLKNGFAHSLLVLAAYEGDELLGVVRTVGDGFTVVFVQDLLVDPAYQGKGVGSALLTAVLERFPHVRQIELVTDDTERTVAFYRAMGFSKLSEIGCCGFMKC